MALTSDRLSRTHDLEELENAAQSGDLDKVQSLWTVIKAEEDDVELAASEIICSVAVEHCQKDVLRLLLSHGIRPTAGAVATAARAQCTDCLTMLLDHGWDINTKLGGRYPPVLSQVLDNENLVRLLLERGADPSADCDIDDTPMSRAITYAAMPIVELLLATKPNLKKGHLMHCAVSRSPPDLDLIRHLAAAGAPVDDTLYNDRKSFLYRGYFTRGTPLHEACREDKVAVAQLLLELGALPDKLHMEGSVFVPPTARQIVFERQVPDMVELFTSLST